MEYVRVVLLTVLVCDSYVTRFVDRALYEDSCLYVVPGSHQIARTPEQRVHSCTIDPPSDPLDMPGAVLLTLKRMLLASLSYL